MLHTASIEIIHSSKLDKNKWDDSVQKGQSLIYSYSWYLDAMADDWYGLIIGDYDAVMALPVKKKLGMRMLAMPAFVQQVSLSKRFADVTETKIAQTIISFSKLVQLNIEDEFFFPGSTKRKRTNFILDLRQSYQSIFDNFTESCKKNIRKAESRGCILSEMVSINDVLRLYRQAYGSVTTYNARHYAKIATLLGIAHKKGMCHLVGILDEKGELVFAGALPDDGKRLYYLLGAPTEKGRQMRATYFFINAMMKRFAEKILLFDFEGSDIPNVAKFYQSFSPQKEYYYQYYINRFPFPINKIIDAKLKPF